jgi:hypothetical protein
LAHDKLSGSRSSRCNAFHTLHRAALAVNISIAHQRCGRVCGMMNRLHEKQTFWNATETI